MAQALVNFRLDEDVKRNMERICSDLGMNMTTAFSIFAKKVVRENGIPFEMKLDPFYSESNIRHLEKIVADIEGGHAKLTEHELIED